jgi:TRAP-type C4-dicarboxylate transport system permease large subunit
MKVAEVKEKKVGYWETFGNWKSRSIDCWLIVGTVIICLLSRQSILESLISSVKETIPFILFYIFTDLFATIIVNSGLSEGLAQRILPTTTAPSFKYWVLFSIFGISLLFNFFVASVGIGTALVVAMAPTLLGVSESALIYASVFAWMGAILGCAFSPFHGMLLASLNKIKMTYQQFIKKTWKLGLIMLVITINLIWFWIKFRVE